MANEDYIIAQMSAQEERRALDTQDEYMSSVYEQENHQDTLNELEEALEEIKELKSRIVELESDLDDVIDNNADTKKLYKMSLVNKKDSLQVIVDEIEDEIDSM